jgi:hypothetical protein
MGARELLEYELHALSIRCGDYAAIENKIVKILNLECIVEKSTNRRFYSLSYYFIEDDNKYQFKTDAALVSKLDQKAAKVLYDKCKRSTI